MHLRRFLGGKPCAVAIVSEHLDMMRNDVEGARRRWRRLSAASVAR
jgi:hypothetical protein